MAEALRPMSTGELLDRTFSLYRKNFKLFVGIATVGPAAYLVFQLLTVGSAVIPGSRSPRLGANAISLAMGMLFGFLIYLAGWALSGAATVKAVAAVHLGLQTTVSGAYRALKGRILRILGVFASVLLLAGGSAVVIIVIASFVGSLAVIGGSQVSTGMGIAGGIFALIVVVALASLAITIWVRYSLSIQACVVEDLRIWASLKRSAILSKGARTRILTISFVFAVLAAVVGGGLGGIVGAVSVLIPNKIMALVAIYLTNFVAGCITGPLGTIGISLLYYDERVRKEAFDLQLMMSSLDIPATPVVAPAQI